MRRVGTTFIHDVRVFDGESVKGTGSVEFTDGVVTLVAVGPNARPRPAPDAEVVDGSGLTLLPGLVDAHTHVFGVPENLELALAFGVTTELDMFMGPADATRALCELAAARDDVADMRSAGWLASAPGGHPAVGMPRLPTVAGPEQAEAFVAARHEEGAHFLKIMVDDGANHGMSLPALDRATVTALVEAARRRGLLTVAHVSALWSARLALDSGVDVLTHLPLEATLDEEFVGRLAAGGRAVLPTLTMLEMSAPPPAPAARTGRALADDPRIAGHLPEHARQAVASGREGLCVEHPRPEQHFGNALASVAALHRAGVPVLAGSDANQRPDRACPVVHGASMHAELALLVDAGLTPAQALAAATSVPAACFGLHDRGVIARGRRADLLLVAGDPTEDITSTRSIEAVWRGGVRFDREAYRERVAPVSGSATEDTRDRTP